MNSDYNSFNRDDNNNSTIDLKGICIEVISHKMKTIIDYDYGILKIRSDLISKILQYEVHIFADKFFVFFEIKKDHYTIP